MNLKKLLKDRMSPDRYLETIHSREEYFKLPVEQRSRKVWYWLGPWYKLPVGLPWDIDSILNTKIKSEWDLCYDELRKDFPIQVFIREDLPHSDFVNFFEFKYRRMRELYYKWVKRTFKPLNQKLVKTIPQREWQDLVTIIPNFLYACVIQFVEDEDCFEHTDFEGSTGGKEFETKLKEVYNFAKSGRAKLQADIETALTMCSKRGKGLTYDQKYGEMDVLEKELKEKDKEYLTWIVTNVDALWT